MLTNHLLALLERMIQMPSLTLSELSLVVDVPKEELKSQLKELNYALKGIDLPCIDIGNDFYTVPPELIKKEQDILKLVKNIQVYLNEEERQHIIFLYTFMRQERVSSVHYQQLLQVSKNTVLADVKKLRERCASYQLNLKYTRAEGYHLQGNEFDKRRLGLKSIALLLQTPIGNWAMRHIFYHWKMELKQEEYFESFKEWAANYGYSFVETRLFEVIYLMQMVEVRNKRTALKIEKREYHHILSTNMYMISQTFFKECLKVNRPEEEAIFFSILLLGTAMPEKNEEGEQELYQLTEEVIQALEAQASIEFEEKERFFHSLYTHLVPTYYRLKYDFQLVNPLAKVIKEENADLFILVKKALSPLEKRTENSISEDEIAYFTIHFGGQIERQMHKNQPSQKYRALIVCPNGISSSLILQNELEKLFPEFEWLQEHSIDGIYLTSPDEYDLIFSTVYIYSEKPLYIVKPIMNQVTKSELVSRVGRDFTLTKVNRIDINNLLCIIRKYTTVKDEEKLIKELSNELSETTIVKRKWIPMLEELLTDEYIQFLDNTNQRLSWKEAIYQASIPLLKNGKIEERYIHAIYQKVEEFGPFIVLGNGVAIPHARPEDGVNALGMSFLKLREPIYLLENKNHKVDLIITLAAIDNESHLKALAQLTRILSEEESLEKLKGATSNKEVIELIKEGEKTID